ncbi:MAG: hypothetical protein II831_03070 [Firmicutes bacterium]|nr:hypothetical protein [Bacillota bacterium]
MDKTGLLVIGVNLLIYAVYFTGVFLFSEQGITAAIRSFSLRKRLKPNDRGFLLDSGPLAYLNRLLFTVFQKEVNGAAFFFGIVMVFFIAFVLGIRLFHPGTALFAALMAASLPVMALVVRMESDRTKGSREGISFVSELYRQYRINNKNIYAAMEGTAASTGDFPVCKRHLYRLLLRLRSSGDPDEIKEYTDQFSFAMGTVWGHMLAVCIRMAARSGTDVSAGLADISEQLKAANARAEERRRMNSESIRMTLFLIPLLYAGTVLLSVFYLDVAPGEYLRNQFGTAEGILFFLFIVFLLLLNLVILRAVSNTKIDY